MQHEKPWTEAETQRLKDMLAAGLTHVKIGSVLGRTEGSINGKAQRIKNSGDKPSPVMPEPKGNEELKRIVEEQQKLIERLRKPRVRLSPWKPDITKGGEFKRILIPDTHGSKIDETAAAAFLHDLEILKPAEIVFMGDHVDCDGFLAEHHTWGHVAETEYAFADDVRAANTLLDTVQTICPKSDIYYIEGNHEQRIEKWITTAVHRSKKGNIKDVNFLRRQFSAELVLGLEKRGINYFERSKFHFGLETPGTIKLGHCHFTHGESIAKHCAAVMQQQCGGNIVFGHTHRVQMHQGSQTANGTFAAWSIGFLGHKQPVWMNTKVSGWSHAYGLQLCRPDGDFLHITVPIINGESLLSGLIGTYDAVARA